MSVVCNLEFIKMTFQVRVKCLICRKLTDPTKGLEKKANAEDLKVLHNKLCAALKLEFSPKFQEWDFADEPFPYCESCGQRLQRLGELIDQLKSIHEEIDGSLATVSALIITSEEGETNASGPSTKPKLGHVKEYFRSLQEKHDYFRKLIIQRFDPRVNVERWDGTCNYNGVLSNENYELVPKLCLLNTEPLIPASPYHDDAAAAEEAVFEEVESKSDTSANVTNGMEPETISGLEPWTASFPEASTLAQVSNKVNNPATSFTRPSEPGLTKNVPVSLPPQQYNVTFDEASEIWDMNGFKFKELHGCYKCLTCGRVISIRKWQHMNKMGNIRQHIKAVHMGIRKKKLGPRKCEECGELCSSMDTLYAHRIRAHLPPKFQCGLCGVKFSFKKDLNRHAMTHNKHGERPYSCEQCDKSFFTKSDLKTHSTVHTSERPEKCSTCGLTFKRRHDLGRHIRLIHEKDRKPVPAIAESGVKVDPDLCGNEGQ